MLKQFFSILGLVFALTSGGTSFAQNVNVQLLNIVNFTGDETLANVCGYWQNGREYALVGAQNGMVIVDITNPVMPVKIVQIPGPKNLWREIKVYKNFAYVTTEGGSGLQIVDMTNLPTANLNFKQYTGDGLIAGQLSSIHALHIDTTKGFVYLYGSNLFGGGAVVLSLSDPYNPAYVGKFDQLGYIHDGYVDNDTLYAGHIYNGIFSVVDMKNKSNPQLLGSIDTPGKFTHNSWLTGDRKHVLTTDEKYPSFLTLYDVSDPTDLRELDRVSTGDGFNAIGHNTHVIGNYAVTSWYKDGFTIADITRPDNIVQVARYDTYPGTNGNDASTGCWGVYPYFPSGTIIASNITPAQLFIFKPTYARACYLEGNIINGCNNLPMEGAKIIIQSGDPGATDQTDFLGNFKLGQLKPGTWPVTVEFPGYTTQTVNVTLVSGETSTFSLTLPPAQVINFSGKVVEKTTGLPIAGANVEVIGATQSLRFKTDNTGAFSKNCTPSENYQAYAGAWGYQNAVVPINANGNTVIELEKGYYDNFEADQGWKVSGISYIGRWERGKPILSIQDNIIQSPDKDSPDDLGEKCYITGNGGGNGGANDVDFAETFLTSPPVNLANYTDAELSFDYWFFEGFGGNPWPPNNDELRLWALTPTQKVLIYEANTSESAWRKSGIIHLKDYMTLSNNIRFQFVTIDEPPGHVLETLVDAFKMEPKGFISNTGESVLTEVSVRPNPSSGAFVLHTDTKDNSLRVEIYNPLGQWIESHETRTGLVFGEAYRPGVYTAVVYGKTGDFRAFRLVKL